MSRLYKTDASLQQTLKKGKKNEIIIKQILWLVLGKRLLYFIS